MMFSKGIMSHGLPASYWSIKPLNAVPSSDVNSRYKHEPVLVI